MDQLLTRIRDVVSAPGARGARFVFVAGPSGSGKSSIIRAGLIPRLKQGELPAAERWIYLSLTPGGDPLAQLATSVGRAARSLEVTERCY
ncbi:MAG: hypothetical protein M1546_12185 [Chloroflexi bacterium]|nr:hypothetical protein [Chloroflexota bacterium]